MTTHGVAELFATLTALPLKPKLTPNQVHEMIQCTVIKKFQIIPLGAKEYEEALNLVVLGNHSSGAIYDALHIVGARSTGCDKLYTLNLRHFQALAPGDPLIASPA
ncbi:MAG: hypothetical protein HOI66_06325 [Verrucomicrobia bacterium]|nr:hypothetical protein [Verrucomicrobiota bacterium]